MERAEPASFLSSSANAIQEQRALDDYLSSLDAKELLRSFEKEKKGKGKEKEAGAGTAGWGNSLRRKLKAIVPDSPTITSPKVKRITATKTISAPVTNVSPDIARVDLPRSNEIVKFLLYNIDVATALIDSVVASGNYHELCTCILTIFRVNRVEQNLIMFCLRRELSANTMITTLFRDNSAGTTLLSSYCKIKGLKVLKKLLVPFINDVIKRPLAIEPDPNRCNELEAEHNVHILSELVHSILDRLYLLLPEFPTTLMCVFQSLHQMVIVKYPEVRTRIIGGFFFLRFLCPVLVAPDVHKITEETITATSRRTFVLASKIIQNISNGLAFGKKEAFMIPFNPLISEHMEKTSGFLEMIANPPENGSYFIPKADLVTSGRFEEIEVTSKEVRIVVSQIIENATQIRRLLSGESGEAFSTFYNNVLKQIDQEERIGWTALEIVETKREIDNTEFANISRDAFMLAREALGQCEDELKEVRAKLEDERIVRQSMQHIIQSMAESIHFQFDKSVYHHIEILKQRKSSYIQLDGEFCDLLERGSSGFFDSNDLPNSPPSQSKKAEKPLPATPRAAAPANEETQKPIARYPLARNISDVTQGKILRNSRIPSKTNSNTPPGKMQQNIVFASSRPRVTPPGNHSDISKRPKVNIKPLPLVPQKSPNLRFANQKPQPPQRSRADTPIPPNPPKREKNATRSNTTHGRSLPQLPRLNV